MAEPQFTWGPLARGLYTGMLWMTIIVAWHFDHYLYHYFALLIFLGLGLRPLLEKTGLYERFAAFMANREERKWRKTKREAVKKVEREKQAQKYKHRRTKDPRLPKNW